jgi:uncharacterized protein
MPRKLKREVGNWVSGERFWGREADIASFTRFLDEGAHLLLVAPRRMGKTSLMREVARLVEHRFTCLFLDLERGSTAADAIVELSLAARPHAGLAKRIGEVFRSIGSVFDEIQIDDLRVKLHDALAGDWQAKGDRILNVLAEQERGTVIFIDELPILVNRLLRSEGSRITPAGKVAADQFVSWIRAAAQRHQGRIRFVISGSIGLAPVLRQAGLSATMNSFTPFDLAPWDWEAAKGCLLALASNYELDLPTAAVSRILARLGCCIPHHVQMFFSHVYEDARHRGSLVCSTTDIDRVYGERMLSARGHAELDHLVERLRMIFDDEQAELAIALLSETAAVGELTPSAARLLVADPKTLRELLGTLEHDGYLRREDDGYRFVSGLFGDWWRERFGFGHVPTKQRSEP